MDINVTVASLENRITRLSDEIDAMKREVAGLPNDIDRKIQHAQLAALARALEVMLAVAMVAAWIKVW